jgi:hypothetical protein
METEKKESFFEKHLGVFLFLGITGFFVLYILFEFFFSGPSPDCVFTNSGCQGENRWGQ